MLSGKVIVFTKPGVPLQLVEKETPAPAANEIVVRVTIAGICGTDHHRISGDLPPPSHPVCFGHEAVGTVEALGKNIKTDWAGTPLSVGDYVYWLPLATCGKCAPCKSLNPLLCTSLDWPSPADKPNAAGFRQFATISERSILYKIPEGTSPASVITFGCAMPTAIGGFERLGKLGKLGSSVVILGAGPVGLASTVLASLAGVGNIIVIGDPPQRLKVARQLGATETISISDTTPEQRHSRVLELTNSKGADVVVEAAGVADAFPQGFDLLGMNGKYLILGLYSGKAFSLIDPVRINNLNLQIIGSLGSSPESYLRTIQIATEHGERLKFEDLITHRFALEEVEDAIRTGGRGESVKAVIIP